MNAFVSYTVWAIATPIRTPFGQLQFEQGGLAGGRAEDSDIGSYRQPRVHPSPGGSKCNQPALWSPSPTSGRGVRCNWRSHQAFRPIDILPSVWSHCSIFSRCWRGDIYWYQSKEGEPSSERFRTALARRLLRAPWHVTVGAGACHRQGRIDISRRLAREAEAFKRRTRSFQSLDRMFPEGTGTLEKQGA